MPAVRGGFGFRVQGLTGLGFVVILEDPQFCSIIEIQRY